MMVPQTITSFLLPLLYIVGLVGTFIYLFRKKTNFQTILPVALMSAALIVFLVTALFHNISLGVWITVLMAVAFIPLFILDKNRWRTLKNNILTPGFILFIALFIFLFILHFGRELPLGSDEPMHWGPHVWTMWLLNDFYQTQEHSGIVIHGDYPPIVQLFEVMWLKLSGFFNEGLLYVAIQVLGFSMLLPATNRLTWKSHKKTKLFGILGAILVLLISLPLVFDMNGANFYTTILLDALLAFIFVYGLYTATIESDQFRWSTAMKISITVAFLCLVKQTALLFAGIIALVFVANLVRNYGLKRIAMNAKKLACNVWSNINKVALVIILLLIPLFCLKLWSIQAAGYVSPDNGVAVFSLSLEDTLAIPDIIQGDAGSGSQQYFSREYFKHFLFDGASVNMTLFGWITYAQWMLLFIGAMVFVWYVCKSVYSRSQIAFLTVAMLLGWCVYYFALYNIFLFGGMNDVERMNIDTTNRYWKTYLLTMLLLVATLLVNGMIQKVGREAKKAWLVLATVLLILWGILFSRTNVLEMKPSWITLSSSAGQVGEEEYYNVKPEEAIKKISTSLGGTFEHPTKILVTGNEVDGNINGGLRRHQLQYWLLPNRIRLLNPNESNEGVLWLFNEDNYLMIDYAGDNIKELLRQTIVNYDELDFTQGSLYKIDHQDGHVVLYKI